MKYKVDMQMQQLTLIEKLDNGFWLCACSCGNTCKIHRANLNRQKSCGCLRKENGLKWGKAYGPNQKTRLIHGHSVHTGVSKYYNAWSSMKKRCYNPKAQQYAHYGARGITVCSEWLNSFEAFYKDMGDAPTQKHQLDRINNDGNYEPNNCRWATSSENLSNRRKFKKK